MNLAKASLERLDSFQQRHRPTAFAFGVTKKFGDDRGDSLAALISYYGFLSLFPLVMLCLTVAGFILPHYRYLHRCPRWLSTSDCSTWASGS